MSMPCYVISVQDQCKEEGEGAVLVRLLPCKQKCGRDLQMTPVLTLNCAATHN